MDLIFSIVMLTALALIGGAAFLWFKRGARKQAGLMVLLAMVMLINVAIWTLPDASGDSPKDKAAALEKAD
jgi:membrane protein implicated in regulation of membrane protease activity